MANVWIDKNSLDNIGDAIRSKLGTQTEYSIEAMSAAIDTIDASATSAFSLTDYVTGNITSINISTATIRPYAFAGSTNIVSIKLTEATTIGERSFINNNSLTTVILSKATRLGDYAFFGCTSLESLTIETNSVCSIAGNEMVIPYNCPIRQGNGHIYVPANLVDSYKADTYWSTYASYITAIPS